MNDNEKFEDPVPRPGPTHQEDRTVTNTFAWLQGLSPIVKVAIAVGVLLGAGWSGHIAFSQQVGIPAAVNRNTARLDAAETQIVIITENSARLVRLAAKVDSVVVVLGEQRVLGEDTYCIVWAIAMKLDVGQQCTLVAPTRQIRER